MKEKIQTYLKKIESHKQIKILLACETGSRAWGFPSPDSDYDVRLVYVHKSDWYMSVESKKDSIEMMLENNDIDISGWELKKSLKLLFKSNPPLLERIQSPILYSVDDEFLADIKSLSKKCYSKIATMHHYLSMAKKILEEIEKDDEFKLKRFFYGLRTATLCKWIVEKDEIPPIEFQNAYKNLNLNPTIVEKIDKLIALKSEKSESYFHRNEPELIEFAQKCIIDAESVKNGLSTGKCKTEELNTCLRKFIKKHDN